MDLPTSSGRSAAAASTAGTRPAERLIPSGAPVEIERIVALRSAIAEGRYAIDSGAIADRMIALDLGEA